MYVKEARIHNFKTYRSAKILLVDGLNVITGPNGCGKSNTLEAIIFGLKEKNPKIVRVQNFSQVINRGTSGYRGRDTSVSLTLSAKNGKDALKLKRGITENGRMIYYINGKKASMKSYMNALLTSSDAPVRYRYLAQGSVIRTAEMTSRERGNLLEDIAGISVYDERRKKALSMLDEADHKLGIAVAKIDEIRANLMNLFYESLSASQKTMAERELNRLLAADKSAQIRERKVHFEKIEEELGQAVGNRSMVRKKRLEEEKKRKNVLDQMKKLNSLMEERGGKTILQLEKERAKLSSEKGKIEWIIKNEEEKLGSSTDDVERLTLEVNETRELLKDARTKTKALEREIAENKKNIEELKGKENQFVSELEKLSKQREELISTSADAARKKDEIYLKGIEKEAERRISKLRRETLEVELDGMKKRLQIIQGNLEGIQRLVDELRSIEFRKKDEIRETSKKIISIEKRKKRITKEVFDAEKIYDRAKALYVRIKVKVEIQERVTKTLKDARKVREVATRGVLPQVRGILSDLVTAPPDMMKLLKIVAGDGWNSILVDSWETAKETYNLARKLDSRVLITVLKDYETSQRKRRGPVKESPLARYVNTSKELEPLVDELFGQTIVVKNLQEAFEKASAGYDAVDEKGEFFVRKGIMGGGNIGEASILKTLPIKDLRDMEIAIENFKKMTKIRRRDIEDLDANIMSLRKEVTHEVGSLENTRGSEKAFRRNLKVLKGIRTDLKKRLMTTQSSLERAQCEEELLDKQMRDLMEDVSRAEGLKLEEAIRSFETQAQKTRSIISEIREEIFHIESRNESLVINQKNLEESIDRVFYSEIEVKKEKLKDFKAKIRRSKRRLKQKEKKKEKLSEAIKDSTDKIAELEKNISEYRRDISNKREETEQIETELKILDDNLEKLWIRIADMKEKKARIHGEVEKLKTEMANLGYRRAVEIANPEYVKELIDVLKAEAMEIGRINLLARSSYISKVENYEKFSKRRNELEAEKNSILEFIDRIDREREGIFLDVFSRVNEKFKEIFHDMSPEGNAELRIEDMNDLINSGVQIMVQFPSKPLIEMASLSGGEKSIVVVAFLLALQTVEPGAIFILDEIDAHLDPINVERFIKVLKKTSGENQVIVSTLKAHVAEAAENLIGITMRRDVSRVIPMPNKILVAGRSG